MTSCASATPSSTTTARSTLTLTLTRTRTRTLTRTRTRTRTLTRTPTPTPIPTQTQTQTQTLTLPLAKVEELFREGLVETGCGITADQVELCFDVVSKGYEQYMHAVKTLDLQASPLDPRHACTVLLAQWEGYP